MDHYRRVRRLKEQYEYHNQKKGEKLSRYHKEVLLDYKFSIKKKLKEMQDELMNLFIIYKKEIQVIKAVEDGYYTAGIKSFNIPKKDKPKEPKKETVHK